MKGEEHEIGLEPQCEGDEAGRALDLKERRDIKVTTANTTCIKSLYSWLED